MKKKRLCAVCGSDDGVLVNTYKHVWMCCNKCGCSTRKNKEKYLVSYFPDFLQKLMLKREKYNKFFGNATIIDDDSKMYDYMALKAEEHNRTHDKIGLFDNFISTVIHRYNIDIDGKRILDISGGNGYFAKQLEEYAVDSKVVMTEYNKASVEYAKNTYQIEAVQFDFNNDCIADLFNKTFDIVMLRFAMMFCLNPSKFFDDLKKTIHKDTIIIIQASVVPSLGAILIWQFDDYTYLVLYQPNTLIKVIEKQGFELVHSGDGYHGPHNYWYRLCGKWKIFDLLYRIPATFKYKNHDLSQKSLDFIFKPKTMQYLKNS